jgi:hypothetical protein
MNEKKTNAHLFPCVFRQRTPSVLETSGNQKAQGKGCMADGQGLPNQISPTATPFLQQCVAARCLEADKLHW